MRVPRTSTAVSVLKFCDRISEVTALFKISCDAARLGAPDQASRRDALGDAIE
jgi:hypothetical protein